MKKALYFLVVSALLTVFTFSLASCSSLPDAYKDVIDTNYTYNESAFAAEMAAVKQNNVNFAQNGKLTFPDIIYPAEIDNIQKDENNDPLPKDATKANLVSAVEFLASTLETMTGDKPNLLASDKQHSGAHAITLSIDAASSDVTQTQGYILVIAEGGIKIVSDDYQGLTNGIYSFLEDRLGCMFAASDFDYIPKLSIINLTAGEYTDTPDIIWRNVYASEAMKKNSLPPWSSKLRLNGARNSDWYRWVHTAFSYIPPSEYFDEHPEYFSYYNGRRTYEQGPVSGQLCWTNEEVYQIISSKVFQEMADNPHMHNWDVSQMDTWINRGVGCKCNDCKAIDEREGSQMGSLLTFINRLADECAEKFPDNFISTLAYNYTAKPPKTLRPRENVIIKLCLMPGDSSSSIASPTSNDAKDSNEIISAWGKIAKHILIWDYNVNFHNYMLPHPALNYIKENHEFYLENNVYGIFHQMDSEKGGVDAELTAYLFAKSMWASETDISLLAAKYMAIYYGSAAPHMREYYNELNRSVVASSASMYIYDTPYIAAAKYFPQSKISYYMDIFDEAIRSADGDAALIARIKKAKLGILYVKASVFSADVNGRKAALDEFYEICNANGIVTMKEGEKDGLQKYYDSTLAAINGAPWIIAGCVIGSALIITAITLLVFYIKKRKKRKAASASNLIS